MMLFILDKQSHNSKNVLMMGFVLGQYSKKCFFFFLDYF